MRAETEATENADRIPALDGLRAISILLVLATHMLPLGPKALRLNETAGAMGMSLFFALSGFLIFSIVLRNPDVLEFLVRRGARIIPLAYAYAFIVFLVLQFDPPSFWATLSFVENYTGHLNRFNGHFWSLCVEVQFYLAVAAVILILGPRGAWLVWPACLLVTGLRIDQGAYIEIKTHLRVDEILAGACVATLYRKEWLGRFATGPMVLGAAVLFWFAASSPHSAWLQYLRPYASAGLLACIIVYQGVVVPRILSSSPMRYVAAISYALYVIHPATIQGWMNQGTAFERYILKRPISFLLTFGLAHLSTYYWERRWLRAAKNFIRWRRGARHAAGVATIS